MTFSDFFIIIPVGTRCYTELYFPTYSSVVLSWGHFFPRGHWLCLETLLVVTAWEAGWLLACREHRLGILLNMPRTVLTAKTYLAQNVYSG